MGELLARKDGFRQWAGLRQLSPRLWALSAELSGELQHATLDIAETAVHRFADWGRRLDPATENWPYWNQAETRSLATLLVFAEYYGNTSAARRRVGKGQSLRFDPDPRGTPFAADPQTVEIEELISKLDSRGRRSDNLVAGVGGYLSPAHDGESSERIIAAERVSPIGMKAAHDTIEGLSRVNLADGQHLSLSVKERDAARRAVDLSCTWAFHPDLGPRRAVMAEYDEPLRSQLGFGLSDIEFVLDVCSSKVITSWESFRFLNDIGFELAPAPTLNDFDLALEKSRSAGYSSWPGVTTTSAMKALLFLDAGIHPGDLSNPLACRPLRIVADTMLYDAVQVRFPSALLWEVEFDSPVQKRFADQFEVTVHEALGGVGAQPWPQGRKVRVEGRELTDADASVLLDDLFIVVDCYNSRWSPTLDIGSFSQTQSRELNLRNGKLHRWDNLWADIARHHPSVLPMGARRVLPVVVTPGAEWVATSDPNVWFDDNTPRICTLPELLAQISSGDIHHHPAIADVASALGESGDYGGEVF